ncbi:GNAT family N-acetyltransferase [Solirhodobacter olei]|uniref:GNAT family N-acetyltransferase n=1 Tax=Solirhodobacter olei TaxID=2493082 RepID=UPI000FDB6B91|nr:GNAT family N-acetyltransferase [Solirhodobacter olei]
MPDATPSYQPFGADALESFDAADLAYTAYNAERSLQDGENALEIRSFGAGLHGLRDPGREESYYNRLVGLSEASLDRLGAAIDWYHAAGRECRATLLPNRATPALIGRLESAGFLLAAHDWIFAIHRSAIATPSMPVAVRRASAEDMDVAFDLWETPDSPIPAKVRALRRPAHLRADFAIYLAEIEGRPAAMATSFVAHGIAWLGNANTREADRRRGCQQALMQHRLWEAREAGCTWAVTDTAFGTATHRNAERLGMHLAFSRFEVRLPAPAGARTPP